MGQPTLSYATAADKEAISALLRASGLPDDVERNFPSEYIVARQEQQVVACAGLEIYDQSGLLRSVAVDPSVRRCGLGRKLVDNRITRARELGLLDLVLLTAYASSYFAHRGFVEISRSDVPEPVKACPQLADECCYGATCMKMSL